MLWEKAHAFWAYAGAVGWTEIPGSRHIVGIWESFGGRTNADGGPKT